MGRHVRPIRPIIAQANAAFPNLEVELGDAEVKHSIISRRIGQYAVVHLKAPAVAVEQSARQGVAAGLGNRLKLIWQLAGRMRYDVSSRKFDIAPGDLVAHPWPRTIGSKCVRARSAHLDLRSCGRREMASMRADRRTWSARSRR